MHAQTGDNILTGISVARDCGMVGEADHVLLAKVTAPSPEHPASLTFEPADTPDILVQYSDDVDNVSRGEIIGMVSANRRD